jgi:pyruvate/2-oxoglutarate/acetoin dehydrogenase E1 component
VGIVSQTEVIEVTYCDAIRRALEHAMAADDRVILLGQDNAIGFPFGATRGLIDRFGPERVRDTPISEAATMGCGVGAALNGMRPVVEVDFSGFLFLGLDQLINNAAKLRYMSNGQLRVPLLVRVGQGPLGSFGAQHSQLLHGWLANVPGLVVCTPSTPQDVYDLTRWSLRQTDPVVMLEDLRLYRQKGTLVENEEDGGLDTSLDARIARPGRDATAVVLGHGLGTALDAAATLEGDGIDLEVVDLRVVSPLDVATIGASARKTGRVVCVSDDPLLGGFGATLATITNEQAHGSLLAPVVRLGARHTSVPYSAKLERLVYPSSRSLVEAVRALVAWEDVG